MKSKSPSLTSMDPIPVPELAHDFRPYFQVLIDGRIKRFDTPHVPPSTDPITGVQSKDVVISLQPKISARIYLPKTISNLEKLPLLIYFHGGAFSSESAFSTLYHTYLNSLVAAVNVIAVSIEYRLAPENPIPACFEDCWTALKWVGLHAAGNNTIHKPDPWINDHADFKRVFLMGDSSGATLSNDMSVRAGSQGGLGTGVKIVGMILIHPFFGQHRMWSYLCPGPSRRGSPWNDLVGADPSSLARVWCDKVLIFTATKDLCRERCWNYYKALKKSDWGGVVEIVETDGEKHVFHLFYPNSAKAKSLMKLVSSFIHHQDRFPNSSL